MPIRAVPTRLLADASMPGARWFEGATLNYAEAVFARAAADRPALVAASERRPSGRSRGTSMRSTVAAAAAGLRRLGVRRGDRVAAIVPNIPEAVVALLATASLGAIWSSCAPEFGAHSVIDRFVQIEPKVLIAVDGYVHAGRSVRPPGVVEEVRAALPHLERTVLIRDLDPEARLAGDAWIAGIDSSSPSRSLSRSSPSPSTTRCGSSSRPARPGCRRPSSTGTAGSSSSTPRPSGCTSTSAPAIGSSGTRRPAG